MTTELNSTGPKRIPGSVRRNLTCLFTTPADSPYPHKRSLSLSFIRIHIHIAEQSMPTPQSTPCRTFLRQATAYAGAALYFPWSQPVFANRAANDRPRVASIGVGGMGCGDARGHAHFGDIVAICDVDRDHAVQANLDENIGKGRAELYGDYRRVLERSDIDLVSIATPDHWHVKIAIEAPGIRQARLLPEAADSDRGRKSTHPQCLPQARGQSLLRRHAAAQ